MIHIHNDRARALCNPNDLGASVTWTDSWISADVVSLFTGVCATPCPRCVQVIAEGLRPRVPRTPLVHPVSGVEHGDKTALVHPVSGVERQASRRVPLIALQVQAQRVKRFETSKAAAQWARAFDYARECSGLPRLTVAGDDAEGWWWAVNPDPGAEPKPLKIPIKPG